MSLGLNRGRAVNLKEETPVDTPQVRANDVFGDKLRHHLENAIEEAERCERTACQYGLRDDMMVKLDGVISDLRELAFFMGALDSRY